MGDFLIYTAKVAAALVVFYLFFRLLLSRETFHRLNRIALMVWARLAELAEEISG